MLPLEALKGCERHSILVETTLVYGSEVQSVASFRQRGLELCDPTQRVEVTAPLGELANSRQLHGTFIGLQLGVPTLHRLLIDQWPSATIIAPRPIGESCQHEEYRSA
jgi:hypothetical protein